MICKVLTCSLSEFMEMSVTLWPFINTHHTHNVLHMCLLQTVHSCEKMQISGTPGNFFLAITFKQLSLNV